MPPIILASCGWPDAPSWAPLPGSSIVGLEDDCIVLGEEVALVRDWLRLVEDALGLV